MSERDGLDERLRAALGVQGDPAAVGSADAAKSRVLSGIRHRRQRRLQVLGAMSVVAIGLAAALPQVFGGAAPRPQATGTAGKASRTAPLPAYSSNAGASSPAVHAAAPALSATCRVKSRTVPSCGDLVTGSGAGQLKAEATSTGKQPALGVEPANKNLPALAVRAGTRIVVQLPDMSGQWRWTTPTIAGTPVYHGSGPPVTVRAIKGPRGAQSFVVSTKVGVTIVLEAQAEPVSSGAASNAGPVAVWALDLKVEGK